MLLSMATFNQCVPCHMEGELGIYEWIHKANNEGDCRKAAHTSHMKRKIRV